MDIYLPIAGVAENLLVILGLGTGIGLLSGMCGVGGGFLLTPLLIQIGIPAPVAVASAANQVAGASVSGCLGHWQRGNVDVKMGLVLLGGGLLGSSFGVLLFGLLRRLGQIDLTISLCYVILLGALGGVMLVESLNMMLKRRRSAERASGRLASRHLWIHHLPLKMRFRRSKLYISALVPAGVGFFVGLLSAIMGVGGGFVIVPAMIYLVGMPTAVVIGTSLFQIMFVSANVTFLQAFGNQTVDVVLATLLLVGGTIGAQIGTRLGAKLRAEQLRVLLAVMVLAMSVKVFLDLTVTPVDIYSISITAI
jgi:uncharacterized membrane protein YfcA